MKVTLIFVHILFVFTSCLLKSEKDTDEIRLINLEKRSCVMQYQKFDFVKEKSLGKKKGCIENGLIDSSYFLLDVDSTITFYNQGVYLEIKEDTEFLHSDWDRVYSLRLRDTLNQFRVPYNQHVFRFHSKLCVKDDKIYFISDTYDGEISIVILNNQLSPLFIIRLYLVDEYIDEELECLGVYIIDGNGFVKLNKKTVLLKGKWGFNNSSENITSLCAEVLNIISNFSYNCMINRGYFENMPIWLNFEFRQQFYGLTSDPKLVRD